MFRNWVLHQFDLWITALSFQRGKTGKFGHRRRSPTEINSGFFVNKLNEDGNSSPLQEATDSVSDTMAISTKEVQIRQMLERCLKEREQKWKLDYLHMLKKQKHNRIVYAHNYLSCLGIFNNKRINNGKSQKFPAFLKDTQIDHKTTTLNNGDQAPPAQPSIGNVQ
ncbi:hypothetical protein LXL04_017146 [Taraxacum kok-saghyz]